MPTDPPAAALGAQDAPWLARLRRLASMPMLADASRISVGLADLQAAVDAVDAQAARLAAWEPVYAAAVEMDACGPGEGERFAAAYSALLAALTNAGAVGAGEAGDG